MAPPDPTMERWTVNCFAQSNPKGPRQGDVPALLRRVAVTVEELGAIEVQGMTMDTEITEDGPWPSLNVYYQRIVSD